MIPPSLRLLALAIAFAGCARCAPAAVPDAGNEAPSPPQPTKAWLEGVLPPSALEGTPKPGGTLTVRVPQEPRGLSRLHDQMSDATMVRYTVGTVYETLGRVDPSNPSGALLPWLAHAWEVSDDQRTLTIHLRRGVTFHDGSAFDAADVKAVLDAVLAPANPTTSIRSFLLDIDRVTTPDASTVLVHWKKLSVLGNRTLLGSLTISPSATLQGEFDTLPLHRAPVGTGPFRFEAWESGQRLTFARNEKYWGRAAHLDRLVIRFVRDETVAAQLWERGELDVMTRIPSTVWRALEAPRASNAWAIEGYHRVAFQEPGYSFIAWNQARSFFQDSRVRKALAMVYPAKLVSEQVDLGLEPRTTCPYSQAVSCDPTVVPWPQDERAAERLLDEAGWKDSNGDGVRDRDGVPFSFSFLVTSHSLKMAKVAPLLQEALRRVGIDMAIERVDGSIFVSRLVAHDFGAAALAWSSVDGTHDLFQIFHSSQAAGGSNYVGYSSPQVDAMLEQIRAEPDAARRAGLERQVHRKLFDDQVYLFLTVRPSLDAIHRRVHGLAPRVPWYDFTQAWVEPEAR